MTALPTQRPSVKPAAYEAGSIKTFDWVSLVALTVHPIKVAIIEALLWVGEPLSATEMMQTFDGAYSLDLVKYHAGRLRDLKLIEVTHERQARGAREKYYDLSASLVTLSPFSV